MILYKTVTTIIGEYVLNFFLPFSIISLFILWLQVNNGFASTTSPTLALSD